MRCVYCAHAASTEKCTHPLVCLVVASDSVIHEQLLSALVELVCFYCPLHPPPELGAGHLVSTLAEFIILWAESAI